MYSVAIAISDDGSYTLVPAVPGRRIRVVNYTIVGDANNNTIQFFSNVTALTGIMHITHGNALVSHAGQLFPAGALMLFQTATGEPLKLTTTANGGIVGGHLTYVLVD